MKTITQISVAALLAAGLASGAFAQSEEPDCPEDFDTEPGCDMSAMDADDSGSSGGDDTATSESQPVEGAATAPTADGEGEGSKTMEGPEADPSQDAAGDEASGDGDDSGSDGEASAEGGETVEVLARAVSYEPAIIFIEPGDTVTWSNMDSHNIETLEGMIPEGQETIATEVGASVTRSFETEGIIVYKCTPHWGNRMGGIIVVGDPENPLETVEAYMQSAEENTVNLPALGLLKDLRAEFESRQ